MRLLLTNRPELKVCGVDPSSLMNDYANRQLRAAQLDHRVDLQVGSAEQLPFTNNSVQSVVSVNTVAFFEDRRAAFAEMARILIPGGRAVIAWHNIASPNRIQRELGLLPDELDLIENELAEAFGNAFRESLVYSVLFSAVRR